MEEILIKTDLLRDGFLLHHFSTHLLVKLTYQNYIRFLGILLEQFLLIY